MKQKINWQTSGAMMVSMALAITAFPAFSNAAPNDGVYYQARTTNACRQVSRAGGINVRQQPSVNSRIIGRIANGLNVTIRNLGDNGWVRITAPVNGYVAANNLTYCASFPRSPKNVCRKVTATGGLNVRQQPSINSRIVGRVANRRNVTIRNLGDNGWVRISAPLRGYVAANYLRYCS
ncbi:MAG: SH3 domain-containing protein [Crinalium sp.]